MTLAQSCDEDDKKSDLLGRTRGVEGIGQSWLPHNSDEFGMDSSWDQ
jgi:hypothetical protein